MLSGLIIIAGQNVAHRGLLIEAAQGEEAVAPVLGPCVLTSSLGARNGIDLPSAARSRGA